MSLTVVGSLKYVRKMSKPRAQFLIIVRDGIVHSVVGLNGQTVPYMLVDEDDLMAMAQDSDRLKPGEDFDVAAEVNFRMSEDPDYFWREMDGAMSLYDVYPEPLPF